MNSLTEEIYGKLLFNISVLSILPDEKRFSDFLLEALKKIPGVSSIGIKIYNPNIAIGEICKNCQFKDINTPHSCTLENNENYYVYELNTPNFSLGKIIFELENQNDFKAFFNNLSNILVFMTVQFENIRFRNETKKLNDELTLVINRLKQAQKISKIGCWDWSPITNEVKTTKETNEIFEIENMPPPNHPEFLNTLSNEDKELFSREIDKAIYEKKNTALELKFKNKNNETKIVTLIFEVVLNDDKRVEWLLGTAQDITEQKENEDAKLNLQIQMMRNEKLVSLGTLVAGIGHEINNPLFFAMGYLDELKEKCLSREVCTDILDNIKKIEIAHNRILEIIKKMSALQSIEYEEHEILNINELLFDYVKLIEEIFKKDGFQINLRLNSKGSS